MENKIVLRRWLQAVACVALLPFFFTACSQEADRVVYQPRHHWVDKHIAVVARLSDAGEKARLERTAQWLLDNFQTSQLSGDTCLRLHLQWYDEDTEDMSALGARLAADDSVAVVVGPFGSEHVSDFAAASRQTEKPIIAPAVTSEELIRRYAVPTQMGLNTVHPFLWSLTETDVAFSEVVMSAFAAASLHDNSSARGAVLSPDNLYGQTFFDWTPFQAANLGIALDENQRYSSADDMVKRLRAILDEENEISDENMRIRYSNFCVIEHLQQLYDAAYMRRERLIEYYGYDEDHPSVDDPYYDTYSFESMLRTYFAYADISQEELDKLSASQLRLLNTYQGFAPYADPTTGFELGYEGRYGVKPTFAECKFYDGLMLAAFACYKQVHDSSSDTDEEQRTLQKNRAFNQAIYDLCFPNATRAISATVWSPTAMKLYLEALRRGQLLQFRGASGDISFDPETCTPATGTYYIHWQINDGRLNILNYFSSVGNHRVGDATAAWRYLYDEAKAQNQFASQAQDQDVDIAYGPLADQYVVLVHGSRGYANYRHLSDVLSIYQHMRAAGFDDDHIILIADPSLAFDSRNSEPGIIRNAPDGPDLMQHVQIDYNAAQLSAADVAAILSGQSSDRLPIVVPPDAGNNILFYWSGHGRSHAQGGSDEFEWRGEPAGRGFTRDLLSETVEQMHEANSYRKIFIVAEPCYAEVVVKGIEGIPGVLAMTGANAQEQSWADHWNKDALVWMCDRFTDNFTSAVAYNPDITYRDLYLYCAQRTLGSHACIVNAAYFGNLYHTGPAEFVQQTSIHRE